MNEIVTANFGDCQSKLYIDEQSFMLVVKKFMVMVIGDLIGSISSSSEQEEAHGGRAL